MLLLKKPLTVTVAAFSILFLTASWYQWTRYISAKIQLETLGTYQVIVSDEEAQSVLCSAYHELRHVNFLDRGMKRLLCKEVEAYTIVDSAFPLCDLRNSLPPVLVDAVKNGSYRSYLISPLTNRNITCFVYSSTDYISTQIRSNHIFEGPNVKAVQSIVAKLSARSQVTFMDIGANIGGFTLPMLDLGVPVVALDANIRNLMRIKLSAEALNVPPNRLHLLWNFINRRTSLMYLNFPADCNIGGATKFDRAVPDTIPVMSTTADSIARVIRTRSVVLKVDIEGGEVSKVLQKFFKSAEQLFDTFSIPAVHMEWLQRHMSKQERLFIIKFFTDRKYSPRSIHNLARVINITDPAYEGDELIWVQHRHLADGTFVV